MNFTICPKPFHPLSVMGLNFAVPLHRQTKTMTLLQTKLITKTKTNSITNP